MARPERIGVFGGTFDPIHNTHLSIARAAREQAELDRILFMVSARPPHKHGDVFAEAEDRFAMVEAAVAGEPGFEASRIEMDRRGPSFTIDTLRELECEHPGAELFLIIGHDSLLELPRWRDAEGIVARAGLIVAPRPDTNGAAPAPYADRRRMLRLPESPVSSTIVRDYLSQGLPVTDWVPEGVLRIIRARGLYHAHC